MKGLYQSEYKDCSPATTVAKIKSILAEHDLHTAESWQESVVPYCHALSVRVNGTSLKSNGKGISRELAQASAYGELIERLQMGITGSAESQKASLQGEVSGLKRVSAEQLWQSYQSWYEALSVKFGACTGKTMSAKDILWRFADKEGTVAVREYILPGSGEVVAYPAEIIQRIYCTNGCAAGNTMEEAMVQAISEIVERHHQLCVLHEDLCLPDIPEERLMECETAWNAISFLRENGFQVSVKDCSLGTPFPVVCVCMVHKASGRYHTHFGAFPVFQIALERALTESFQGRNLQNVAQFHSFSTKKAGEHQLRAIGDEVFFGSGEKTRHFFTGTPDFAYNPDMGFHCINNNELLRACVSYFKDEGYDVLVQDRSVLGFPTCQIIIPGISEVMIHRLHPALDDTRYALDASKCLRSPANTSLTEAMALIMHLQQLDQFSAKVRDTRSFSVCARLPMQPDKARTEALMLGTLCHINYTMGRMGEVLKGIDKLLTLTQDEDTGRLICLKRYLTLKAQNYDSAALDKALNSFQPQAYQWLKGCLEAGRNPFENFVLNCHQNNCEDCAAVAICCYHRHWELSKLIAEKAGKLNRSAFIQYLKSI